MKRILAIARKEFKHIVRDPRSLFVALLMPLAMIILYGYAIDMDLKKIRIGLLDLDRSPASRDLVREMTSGNFIVIAEQLSNRSEIERGFRQDKFRAVLVIPDGYAKSIQKQPRTQIQLLIDGADGTTAATVENYLTTVIARINTQLNMSTLGFQTLPIVTSTRIWFNPQMESAYFIVPGLVAIVLMMICSLLTSIAIAREKETGSMEQILTTPVSALQVIIGKVIPYFGIGFLNASMILLAGKFVFGVPMNGSWVVITGYGLLFLLVALSLGIMVSTIARTQQIAMMVALVATLLPTLLLSGFIFPIASMPKVLQIISRIVPASYFLPVIRGVMLKGELWYPVEAAVLSLMIILILGLAVARFRGKVE